MVWVQRRSACQVCLFISITLIILTSAEAVAYIVSVRWIFYTRITYCSGIFLLIFLETVRAYEKSTHCAVLPRQIPDFISFIIAHLATSYAVVH